MELRRAESPSLNDLSSSLTTHLNLFSDSLTLKFDKIYPLCCSSENTLDLVKCVETTLSPPISRIHMTTAFIRPSYILAFSLSFAAAIMISISPDSLFVYRVHAQEMDPIEEINSFIAAGQGHLKTAKSRSYRGRKKVKKRVAKYFEALKSFSSAWRRLNEYQIEDDSLYEQIDALLNEVTKVKEVSNALDLLNAKLMKAMKKDDLTTVSKTAESLIDLDERREGIKYLLSTLSESGQL